jgi:predicted permease
MTRPPVLARRLLAFVLPASHRDSVLGDLDEEFADHVVPGRGRRHARRWYCRQALGSLPYAARLRWREASRRSPLAGGGRGQPVQVALDVRSACRGLCRRPWFALAAVVTGTLGTAVLIAVMSVVDAVLVRPLPYADPAALVHLAEGSAQAPAGGGQLSYPDFLDLQRLNRSLGGVAGYSGGSRTVATPAGPERVPIAEVTAGFFETLGVAPATGRGFVPADALPGSPRVVLLTDGAWRRRYGGDPALVGSSIALNGVPHLVAGILPRQFEFALRGRAELWLPLVPSAAQAERRYAHWLDVIARIRPDVTAAQVRDDLRPIARAWERLDPAGHAGATLAFVSLREQVVRPVRPALAALLAAALLMLMAACVTVAGLALSRSADRAREIAICVALGASPGRIRRQVVLESLLLAGAGGALGSIAGFWMAGGFLATLPAAQRASLPYLGHAFGPRIALAALVVSVLFGLASAIPPAIHAGRAMRQPAARGAGSRSPDRRSRAAVVLVQVAVTIVLLSATALLGRSVYGLLQASPGFVVRDKLTLRVSLPGVRYSTAGSVARFHADLLDRVAALPGVRGAATIDQLPLTGRGNTGTFRVQGDPAGLDSPACVRTVSPGYFGVMGVPLLRGRAFTAADRAGAPPVVLVNRTFAERAFAGSESIGRRLVFPFVPGEPRWEIVGVVGDEQVGRLDREPMPVVYFSFGQQATGAFSLVVHSAAPAEAAAAVRATAARLDPDLPLYDVRTMEQIAADSEAVFTRRQVLRLFALLAAMAAILCALGLYAVVAQGVAGQRREIGVRIALGATRMEVLRMVLARGLRPAAGGIAVGIAGSVVSGRVLQSLLFDVSAADPASLAAAAAAMLAIALIASSVPAIRAARIDPTIALRCE